jgi:FkbM family methyltransferase
MAKSCILDIGANYGEFLLPMASRLPSMAFIGVEPIPELFELIKIKSEELKLAHVRLKRVAIDETPRRARFNVARHADLGVSSLLDFDTASLQQNEYWQGRSDLYFDEAIDVDVVRLDEILDEAGFDHVSFIKIDAQGVDLNVLSSLGRYLPAVDGGMLEVSTTRHSVLYQEEPLLRDVLNFLDGHGFEPYAIKSNDPACAEVNVFFNRKGIDHEEMEQRLQLRGIPLYDGRHYWHIPSPTPALPAEAMGPVAHNEVARARHLQIDNAAAWARVLFWKGSAAKLERNLAILAAQLAEKKSELATARSIAVPAPITPAPSPLIAEIKRMRENERLMQLEISDLRASTSWRVTAPLRALKTLISR